MFAGQVMIPDEPVQARQPAVGFTGAESLAGGVPDGEGVLTGCQRVGHVVDEVALVAEQSQEVRPALGREPGSMTQDAPVLGDGLPVRSERGGLFCCPRSVPQHRVCVRRGLGVMGQPRVVAGHSSWRAVPEGSQDPAVDREAPQAGDLVGDREPGQFVAEGDDVAGQPQHALGHGALGGGQGIGGQGLQQADLYPGTRQGDQAPARFWRLQAAAPPGP